MNANQSINSTKPYFATEIKIKNVSLWSPNCNAPKFCKQFDRTNSTRYMSTTITAGSKMKLIYI